MILTPFEHKFLRSHQNHFSKEVRKKFLLSISGGLDSSVLLYLFNKFRNQMNCDFRVLYVHHGLSSDQKINEFRLSSLNCVKSFCEINELEFLTNDFSKYLTDDFAIDFNNDLEDDSDQNQKFNLGNDLAEIPSDFQPIKELKSESDLRSFRYEKINEFKSSDEILVLAHHLDDLLESQLMDLLRGSRFENWNDSKEFSNKNFRPLAYVCKNEISDYATQNQLKWVEDPTNSDSDNLRNWLRNGFLNELNSKYPGLKENLMKNLSLLHDFRPLKDTVGELEVGMEEWMTYSQEEKKQFVINSARRLGLKSMTQGQILDILKKLDLGQNVIKFHIGPIFWTKTTDRLLAYRRSDEE